MVGGWAIPARAAVKERKYLPQYLPTNGLCFYVPLRVPLRARLDVNGPLHGMAGRDIPYPLYYKQ